MIFYFTNNSNYTLIDSIGVLRLASAQHRIMYIHSLILICFAVFAADVIRHIETYMTPLGDNSEFI